MRWGLLTLGLILVLCTMWRTFDPASRHLACDQIRRGMTYQEVQSILGDGECQSFGTGSVKPGHLDGVSFMQTYRWEDSENTFDVRFEGSAQDLRATEITRRTKDPAEHVELQQSRLVLLLLGGAGLLFVLAGLHGRPQRAVAPPP